MDKVLLPTPRGNSCCEDDPEAWEDVNCAVFQWGPGGTGTVGIPSFLWGGN